MLIVAEQTNIRQAPRKVRLVAEQVKKLGLEGAITQLAVIERRSSLVILKVIKSALANALTNKQLRVEQLELKDVVVKDGAVLKRMRAVSRGRGFQVCKRTCAVRVILETKKESNQVTKATKVEKEN
jgi:large subunit ribosomal protein L22